jgi:predicted metal-binding protein
LEFDETTAAGDPCVEASASAAPEVIVTIIVCSSCRDATGSDARPLPGELLGNATRAQNTGPDIRVEQVECLGNCKRRLSAAMTKPGAWSYVFGDLTPDAAGDLITGARLFHSSTDGLLPWRGRPDSLKRGLVARIPPPALFKDKS